MGLFDTIASFGRRAAGAVGKKIGEFGGALKRFGAAAMPVLRRVGDFAVNNHQGLALLGTGLAHASGNETAKQLASLGMMGSAYLTGKGIGHDYAGLRRNMPE